MCTLPAVCISMPLESSTILTVFPDFIRMYFAPLRSMPSAVISMPLRMVYFCPSALVALSTSAVMALLATVSDADREEMFPSALVIRVASRDMSVVFWAISVSKVSESNAFNCSCHFRPSQTHMMDTPPSVCQVETVL